MKGPLSLPFLRLYGLTLLYFSANALLNVFLPLQSEALGANNTTIGIIMGAYLFTTMFLRPWAGRIIQTYGAVKVLRIILVINGAALILYTVTGLAGFFIARMLQGVCTAFFSMALQIGIVDALPEEERSQGISLYSLFSYVPGILTPLLAIAIWQSGNMDYFTVMMVVIALSTTLFGYTNGRKQDASAVPEQTAERSADAKLSWSQVLHNRSLLKSGSIMLIASLVFGAISTFIPLYALHMEQGNAALFLMLQAGVVVLVRFTFRKKIPSDGRWHSGFMLLMVLLVIASALLIGLAEYGGPLLLYGGAVLIGIPQAIIYPTLTTYLTFVLPKENRNMLLGLFIATADLGVTLGAAVMGPVADLHSYSFMYILCAVISGLMLFIAYERSSIGKQHAVVSDRFEV